MTSSNEMEDLKLRTALRVVLVGTEHKDVNIHFTHVQFDSKNENAFGITNNGILYCADLSTKKISIICNVKSQPTAMAIFMRNGENYALIGLQNGPLVQIRIDSMEVIGLSQGVGEPVKSIAVNCESSRAVTTMHHVAVIWDISSTTPTPLYRLTNSMNSILLKAFFGLNSNNIITCFQDGNIVAWEFPNLKYQAHLNTPLENSSMIVELISVSEDLQLMSLFTADSRLLLFDLTNYSEPQVIIYNDINIKQMEILTLWSADILRKIIIFLTETGDLQFFDVDIKKRVFKHSPKSAFYIKVTVSNHVTKTSSKPIGVILNDGSLEVLKVKITTSNKNSGQTHEKSELKENNVENQALKAPTVPPLTEKDAGSQSEKRSIIQLHEFENLLQKFGEFPEKYRSVIWKHLLELPSNQLAFTTLLARGLHPAFANLENRFPVTELKLLTALQQILSAIAHWCSLFAEVDYLPQQLFPFIKVLHEKPLICFEVIMTYLVSWCHDWFLLYPAPPFQLLAQIDGILEKASPKLFSHFKTHGVSAQMYAWPLLESSLSEVFTREEWLQIWDHVFVSRQPQFLHCVVAAYTLASENTLLHCNKTEEFQKYFLDKNPVPVKVVVEKAKLVQSEYEMQLRKSAYHLHQFEPLTKNTYPLFANFPLEVVENHAYHMRKLRELEAEFLQQRKAVLQIEAEFGSVQEQEEEWKRREAILKATDYLQRRDMFHEEHRLQQQRSRLQALKQDVHAKELLIMEAKKHQLKREYQLQSEANVARLKDAAHWIAVLRHSEFQEAVENAETRNIKQKIEQCRFEMDLLKEGLHRNKGLSDTSHSHCEAQNSQMENPGPKPNENIQNFRLLSHSHEKDENQMKNRLDPVNLEEQLLKLEENNRNMELEIKNVLQQLEIENQVMPRFK